MIVLKSLILILLNFIELAKQKSGKFVFIESLLLNPYYISLFTLILTLDPLYVFFNGSAPQVKTQVVSKAFVNRKSQLLAIYNSFWNNITEFRGKYEYPIASQLFGSGKTSLAINAFNFQSEHVLAVFEEFALSNGLKDKDNVMINYGDQFEMFETMTMYDYFKSMKTVRIDLALTECEFVGTLQARVSYMMWVGAMRRLFGVSTSQSGEFWKEHMTSSTPLQCYLALMNLVRAPIFFVFDEIQAVEMWDAPTCIFSTSVTELQKTALLTSNPDSDVGKDVRLQKQKDFIWTLRGLLNYRFCFMSVGRSDVIYRVSERSPINICTRIQILLPTFSAKDIHDVLNITTIATAEPNQKQNFIRAFGFGNVVFPRPPTIPHPVPAETASSVTEDVEVEPNIMAEAPSKDVGNLVEAEEVALVEAGPVLPADENLLYTEFLYWLRDITGGVPRYLMDCLSAMTNTGPRVRAEFVTNKAAFESALKSIVKMSDSEQSLVLNRNSVDFRLIMQIAIFEEEMPLLEEFELEPKRKISLAALADMYCMMLEEGKVQGNYRIAITWFWLSKLMDDSLDWGMFRDPSTFSDKGRALEEFCVRRLKAWGFRCSFSPNKQLVDFWPWLRGTVLAGAKFIMPNVRSGERLNSADAVRRELHKMLKDSKIGVPSIYLPARKSASPDVLMTVPWENAASTLVCVECKNWQSPFNERDLEEELESTANVIKGLNALKTPVEGEEDLSIFTPNLPILYIVICTGGTSVASSGKVMTYPQHPSLQVLVLNKGQVEALIGRNNVEALLAMAG